MPEVIGLANHSWFTGKVALITGGTGGGIGTAIARILAESGAIVYVNYRCTSSIHHSASALVNSNRNVRLVKADIAVGTEVSDMVQQILNEVDGVDLLVHNAAPS